MKTPPDHESLNDTTGLPHAMKLETSQYGVCRSPRNWSNTIDENPKETGITATTPDRCVNTFYSDDTLSIVTMYVEDLLLIGGRTPMLNHIKTPADGPIRNDEHGKRVDGVWHPNHQESGG